MKTIMNLPLAPEIKRSLTASWKEGVVTQVMIGILDYYLTPFALFLGATTQQVGFLSGIPNLLSSGAQIFVMQGVRILNSRLQLIKLGVALQAILLIPVALLPFTPVPGKVFALIILVAVYRILGSQIGPAWGSLMSDYLAPEQRGKYFGWRLRLVNIAGILGISFWGIILYLFKQITSTAIAFTILFSAASMFRFLSYRYIAEMHDLPMHEETTKATMSFWVFLKRFRESNFSRFIIYVTCMTFAVQLAQPFFAVRMLSDLHFSYLTYTIVYLASVVASLIAFPIWGRHADVVGNAKVLKETGALTAIIPIFWIFLKHPVALFLTEFYAGLVFSGFTLATTNFIYDSCSSSRRVYCLVYYNLLNGIALFVASSFGGYLSTRLPPLFGYPLSTLFAVSVVLSLLCNFILTPMFEEVRISHRKVSSMQLYLSVLGIRPFKEDTPQNTEQSDTTL